MLLNIINIFSAKPLPSRSYANNYTEHVMFEITATHTRVVSVYSSLLIKYAHCTSINSMRLSDSTEPSTKHTGNNTVTVAVTASKKPETLYHTYVRTRTYLNCVLWLSSVCSCVRTPDTFENTQYSDDTTRDPYRHIVVLFNP